MAPIRAITANGDKPALCLVAKGKSNTCHTHFAQNCPAQIWHSPSGLVGQDVLGKSLDVICDCVGSGPVGLIADQRPVHVTAIYLLKARDLKIQLVFVPRGATSICQTLYRDPRNNEIKAGAKLNRRTLCEGDLMLNKQSTAAPAQSCSNEITSEAISEGRDTEGIRTEFDCTG
jgi:hypothetical protein